MDNEKDNEKPRREDRQRHQARDAQALFIRRFLRFAATNRTISKICCGHSNVLDTRFPASVRLSQSDPKQVQAKSETGRLQLTLIRQRREDAD